MRTFAVSTLAVLTFLPDATAQGRTRTIPKVFTGYHAPGGNVLPYGRTRALIQTWYRGSDLPIPQPILDIGWRTESTVNHPALQHTIEIVLTSTTATFSTLSKTFTSNLGQDQTIFFSLKQINLPAVAPPHDPNVPALWIMGDRPFVFRGPHFLVQVDIQTTAAPVATSYFSDAYSMGATSSTTHVNSEPSCGGPITASFGSSYDLAVTGVIPNGFAIFMLGYENTVASGLPLPLDLSSSGMTGCNLGLAPVLLVPVGADPSGRATTSIPFAIPGNGDSAIVHAQALHASTANSTGLATSDVAHSILGGAEHTNYLYNWTVYGPTAEFGPYPTNRGAVILLRP